MEKHVFSCNAELDINVSASEVARRYAKCGCVAVDVVTSVN
jgi:hypothetical protein